MATALVAYANGSEDMEVTSVAAILSRGGVKVTRVAITDDGSKEVVLSHGTKVVCDLHILEAQDNYDIIVLPGGLNGSQNCANSEALISKLKQQQAQGRFCAAICAAPGFVLAKHGLIGNAKATGYPGCSDNINNYQDTGTCIDLEHKIVTGKGPAYSIDFGLACLSVLVDQDTLNKVKSGMLYQD